MDHLKLKLSDEATQHRLETIMGQLDWQVVGRSVYERDTDAPKLGYRLTGPGDTDTLLDALPRIGYALAQPHKLETVGDKTTLYLSIRQTVPTLSAKQGGPKTFGEAY